MKLFSNFFFLSNNGLDSGNILSNFFDSAVVKPGRVLFEISDVSDEVAKEALRLATHKLPCKCKVVSRADLEGGESNEN